MRCSQARQLRGESLEQRRVLAAYIVNTADDVVAEDGWVSLREAIQAANTNAAVNADTVAGETGPGVIDTITFADGLSIITLGSELAITDSLTISLGTTSAQAISGGDASRIFTINGGDADAMTTVSLQGLTLRDGIAERGGAIFVSSGQTLSLDSVTLTNNVATGAGANSGGGALFNDGGSVNIVDSNILDNSAAAAASVSLTGVQENPPVTTVASGDAVFVYDPASNTFSIDLFVTGVEVEADDDGIPQVTGAHLHLGEVGENGDVIVDLDESNFVSEAGGIRLRLTGVDFPVENVDDLIAGGIYINVHSSDNLSGEVRGQLVFAMTMGSGGGLFNLNGTMSITDTMITGNVASRAGGGVESSGGSVEFDGVTLADNIAGPDGFATPGNGGGLHISADGNATITGGMVSGNLAAREGGGLWNSVGTMTVDGTTITGNIASGDAADDGGGGVFNNGGALTISNAVLTGNVADGTLGRGGGIFSTDGNVVINSTRIGGPILADGNTANGAGGGIEVIEGNVTLNFGTDISSNSAGINGGGLHSTGTATVTSNFAIFGSNTAAIEGGGLWNSSTGTLDINGGAITSNIASGDEADNGGGGVFNDGGIVTIDDAVIGFNIADGASGSGGGILNDGGTLTIGGNTNISGNRANRAGGGIEVTDGSTTTISGASIGSNLAGVSPAVAAPGNGGGVHVGGNGVVTITGGNVTDNQAVEGGGLWNSGAGTLSVEGTTITGNTAVRGGGVYQQQSSTLQTFTVDLQTLNAAYGSTARGTATITLDTSGVTGPNSGTASIRVQMDADGLQDLSSVTGGIHVAHIHGQFAGNASRPLADQGSGPFFSGEGGVVVDSITPTAVDDGAKNIDETAAPINAATDYLDFFEGRPDYGPVVLNLTNEQLESAPDGIGPLTFFFQELAAGRIPADAFPNGTMFTRDTTYTFDLSDPDERRQYNNLTPLETREIVLHGLTIPTAISDAIDAATNAAPGSPTAGVPLGNGMSFRRTAPVAAGEIERMSGSTMIMNATISNNTATGDDAEDGGGGIHNSGSLVVTDSEISGNVANGNAGSGGGVLSAGTFSAHDTEISGNTANRAGGGIEAIAGSATTLMGVRLSDNVAGPVGAATHGNGGGLHITGDGAVSLTETTVDGNTAANEGGGLWNSAAGTLNVVSSTLSNNFSGDGGGIFNDGSGGNVSVTNSTIAGNTAFANGGGIASEGAMVTLTSVTIADNSATTGGGISSTGGTVSAINSIVSRNTAGTDANVFGTLTDEGNNLIDVAAGLGTLADNGGPTQTIALLAGSPALDAGVAAGLATDQRGVARPQGNAIDIGAFESDLEAPTPTLSIAAADADKNEGDSGSTAFTFTVTRGNVTSGQTTVDFNVTGTGSDPANASDFAGGVLPSGTVTFMAGQSTQTITVNVAGDALVEPNESFVVNLSNASGGATITTATATGIIRNDDVAPTPTLSIVAADADKNEGDSGSTAFTFTVTRGNVTSGQMTVDFNVTGTGSDPANASDFAGGVLPSGTVTFMAGQSTQTITVNVAGDALVEPNESFVVNLSNPSGGATITTATATGIIRNDDVPAGQTFSIFADNAIRDECNAGLTPFTFRVSRTGESSEIATVDFAVTGLGNDPAAASDFGGMLPSGTVTFAVGEVTKLLTVNVLGDNGIEQDERFSVTLSNPSGDATITTAVANGTILDDDFVEQDNRILVPSLVVRPHVIPGDSIPTAIIFQALSDTTVTVVPIGIVSVGETIRIVDGNTNPISSFTDGVTTATVMAGGLYAVIFEPQTTDRLYSIGSSAGFDTLSNSPPTNIFQPTDTNASGETTAVDALIVINELNSDTTSVGSGEQVALRNTSFMDVNRDGHITALDALLVINYLNRQDQLSSVPTAEAEQIVPPPARESSPFNAAREINDVAVTALFDREAATPLIVDAVTDAVDQAAIFGPLIGANAADAALEDSESQGDELNRDIELLASII